jgi:hypothetical protein
MRLRPIGVDEPPIASGFDNRFDFTANTCCIDGVGFATAASATEIPYASGNDRDNAIPIDP